MIKCSKCDFKTDEHKKYFALDKNKLNGFQSNCKKCRKETAVKYFNTEKGYFKRIWSHIFSESEKRGIKNEFKNFEEFYKCWEKKKNIYGLKCPYTKIDMTFEICKTMIDKNGKKRKPRIATNLSVDRILSFGPYNEKNIIFVSFTINQKKNATTPQIAKRFLELVKERYKTDEI